MRKQYKVVTVTEGALGTILLGASVIPEKKVEETLNAHGAEGWDLEFMVVERRRMALFWQRETVIITLSKPL